MSPRPPRRPTQNRHRHRPRRTAQDEEAGPVERLVRRGMKAERLGLRWVGANRPLGGNWIHGC